MYSMTVFYRFFILVLLLFSFPARADDVFSVEGVSVTETGKDASEARVKAIAAAETKAFETLVQRLKADNTQAPTFSTEQIHNLVQGIEVQNEKMTQSTYSAMVSVTFNPNMTQALLGSAKIATSSQPKEQLIILVLPIYRVNNGPLILWDGDNPWRNAWEASRPQTRGMNAILPLGDLEDISTAKVNTVLSSDSKTLFAMAKKYHAKHLLIALAHYQQPSPAAAPVVDITLRLLSNDGVNDDKLSIPGQPGKSTEDLLQDASWTVLKQLEKDWEQASSQRQVMSQTRTITIPIQDLKEWVAIREKLNKCDFLEKKEVRSISADQIDMEITFTGDMATLSEELQQQGFTLEQSLGKLVLQRN